MGIPERIHPTESGMVYYEHLSRYEYARSFVAGKRVLDTACGTGYGTHHLSLASPEVVVGVDLSSDAIEYAHVHYSSKCTYFARCDCRGLPFPGQSFDVITCFEFIEHIVEQSGFLAELNRVLAPGGHAIISTPNGTYSAQDNPYHLRELSLRQFRALLTQAFKGCRVTLYGQRFHEGLWVTLSRYLDVFNLRRFLRPLGYRVPNIAGPSRFRHDDGAYTTGDFVYSKRWLLHSLVYVAVVHKAD